MISNLRTIPGFIDISKLKHGNESNKFWVEYENKKYYFKVQNPFYLYNELIAEELANDFKINTVHYDIARYYNYIGVISEDFKKENDKYISMKEILRDYYIKTGVLKDNYYDDEYEYLKIINISNNLEDIWNALEYKYIDKEIVQKLMNQLTSIFMFDVLIGNLDRHTENYGIIENDNEISFAPLFDNEKILSNTSILKGGYSIGIDQDDYFDDPNDLKINDNFLLKFLKISSSEYTDIFKSKLGIISNENINNIFDRIEKRTNSYINERYKNEILKRFEINREMINFVLENIDARKLG